MKVSEIEFPWHFAGVLHRPTLSAILKQPVPPSYGSPYALRCPQIALYALLPFSPRRFSPNSKKGYKRILHVLRRYTLSRRITGVSNTIQGTELLVQFPEKRGGEVQTISAGFSGQGDAFGSADAMQHRRRESIVYPAKFHLLPRPYALPFSKLHKILKVAQNFSYFSIQSVNCNKRRCFGISSFFMHSVPQASDFAFSYKPHFLFHGTKNGHAVACPAACRKSLFLGLAPL